MNQHSDQQTAATPASSQNIEQKLLLTPFEKYMLNDDRKNLPMTFFLRLSFAGKIQKDKFTKAVAGAISRHPLFQSLIDLSATTKHDKPSWIRQTPQTMPYINFSENIGELFWPPPGAHIDLSKEIGIRFFVNTSQLESVISLQIHHSCADATGGLEFLADVFKLYQNQPNLLATLDEKKLQGRHDSRLSKLDWFLRSFLDLKRSWGFFAKFPRPIAANQPAQNSSLEQSAYPTTRNIEYSQTICTNLRNAAKQEGATLNDLLIQQLLLAIDSFNQMNSGISGRRNIRLGIPINMRRAADIGMPAANIVSMCFLDRKPKQLNNAAALLKGIVRETRHIKADNMGLTLLRVLGVFSKINGGLKFLVTPRAPYQCSTTAILSNLGEVFKSSPFADDSQEPGNSEDIRLKQVELLPPFRPFTHAAFGVATFSGRLTITMNYNPLMLSSLEADKLVGELDRLLRSTLA